MKQILEKNCQREKNQILRVNQTGTKNGERRRIAKEKEERERWTV
jgi:hypothetical protein